MTDDEKKLDLSTLGVSPHFSAAPINNFMSVGSQPGPCQFMATAVQPNSFSPSVVAQTMCTAHGWQFAPGEIISGLCPLGRIEVATQAAIAQIQAAVPKP